MFSDSKKGVLSGGGGGASQEGGEKPSYEIDRVVGGVGGAKLFCPTTTLIIVCKSARQGAPPPCTNLRQIPSHPSHQDDDTRADWNRFGDLSPARPSLLAWRIN